MASDFVFDFRVHFSDGSVVGFVVTTFAPYESIAPCLLIWRTTDNESRPALHVSLGLALLCDFLNPVTPEDEQTPCPLFNFHHLIWTGLGGNEDQ